MTVNKFASNVLAQLKILAMLIVHMLLQVATLFNTHFHFAYEAAKKKKRQLRRIFLVDHFEKTNKKMKVKIVKIVKRSVN